MSAVHCSIDASCIACNACVEVSPALFGRSGCRIMVRHQPQGPAQLRDVREAQAACPVGALQLEPALREHFA